MLWHEIIEKYPGNGSSAVLILMFLTFGQDYPYNIARTLKPHENILKKRGLGRLSHGNLVSATMNQMEKDGLIIAETANSLTIRKYYSLNPEVIRTPVTPNDFPIRGTGKKLHVLGKSITNIDLVNLFLAQMSTLLKLYSLNIPLIFDIDNFNKYINVGGSIHFELLKNRDKTDEQRKEFIANYSWISEITVKQLIPKLLRKFIYFSKLDFISFT